MAARSNDRQKKSKPTPSKKKAARRSPVKKKAAAPGTPQCGLCGATKNLIKTECCDQWICDDEENYVLFSYARNSCLRNHWRLTLCGYHFCEGHSESWKDCKKCRNDFDHELEMYVYYGTNEYNFDILENPPKYEPTKCNKCKTVIHLADGGYSTSAKDGYLCFKCSAAKHPSTHR